jgi:hypothetical protein
MTEPTKSLEGITVDFLRAEYERLAVPPNVPPDDFARGPVNRAYVTGFGAMVQFAQRLERETPERRAAILQGLFDQVQRFALVFDSPAKPNG